MRPHAVLVTVTLILFVLVTPQPGVYSAPVSDTLTLSACVEFLQAANADDPPLASKIREYCPTAIVKSALAQATPDTKSYLRRTAPHKCATDGVACPFASVRVLFADEGVVAMLRAASAPARPDAGSATGSPEEKVAPKAPATEASAAKDDDEGQQTSASASRVPPRATTGASAAPQPSDTKDCDMRCQLQQKECDRLERALRDVDARISHHQQQHNLREEDPLRPLMPVAEALLDGFQTISDGWELTPPYAKAVLWFGFAIVGVVRLSLACPGLGGIRIKNRVQVPAANRAALHSLKRTMALASSGERFFPMLRLLGACILAAAVVATMMSTLRAVRGSFGGLVGKLIWAVSGGKDEVVYAILAALFCIYFSWVVRLLWSAAKDVIKSGSVQQALGRAAADLHVPLVDDVVRVVPDGTPPRRSSARSPSASASPQRGDADDADTDAKEQQEGKEKTPGASPEAAGKGVPSPL